MSSFEYNSGRGRYSNFFVTLKVKDKTKLLGIATLGSDIQGYSARDDHIGWSHEVRAKKREHIVNMRVCIPTQPFGFNFLAQANVIYSGSEDGSIAATRFTA